MYDFMMWVETVLGVRNESEGISLAFSELALLG